jgi:hypothetical protein
VKTQPQAIIERVKPKYFQVRSTEFPHLLRHLFTGHSRAIFCLGPLWRVGWGIPKDSLGMQTWWMRQKQPCSVERSENAAIEAYPSNA